MYQRLVPLTILCLALAAIVGCSQQTSTPTTPALTPVFAATTTGNGAPNGAHYNLNIIGVPKNKTADMTGDNGHRIFVPLYGNAKIYLAESDTFAVLDANGTDGNGAKFTLPNPDPNLDMVSDYVVYARALGKPNGSSRMTSCFTDTLGDTYCSVDTLKLTRTKGQQKFTDVSSELLTVYADINGDGLLERTPLFADSTYNFYWSYDNTGLKLAQLRFYPIPGSLGQ